MIIFDLKDDISDLKERNLLINKQKKKETEILKKQLNEYEECFNNEEKKRIENKRY